MLDHCLSPSFRTALAHLLVTLKNRPPTTLHKTKPLPPALFIVSPASRRNHTQQEKEGGRGRQRRRLLARWLLRSYCMQTIAIIMVATCGCMLGRVMATAAARERINTIRRLQSNPALAFVAVPTPTGQTTVANWEDYRHRRNGHHSQHHQQQHQQIQLPRRHRSSSSTRINDADTGEFYANPKSYPDFESLGITSSVLLNRLTTKPGLGLTRPSAVQAAVFETISRGEEDVIVGAETGELILIFVCSTPYTVGFA